MRRVFLLVRGIVTAGLCLGWIGAAQAEGLAGVWEGRYSCEGRVEGRMVLDLTGADGQVEGVFRFDHPDGAGAFQVIGREDGAGGFVLAPQDWIERPKGMMALTVQGQFKAGGRAIEGTLIPCGAGGFVAEPAKAADAPPPEMAEMAALSGGPLAGVWRGGVSCSSNRRGKTEVYPIELHLAMDGDGVGGGGMMQIYKARGSGEGPAFEQKLIAQGLVEGGRARFWFTVVDVGGAPIQLRTMEVALESDARLAGDVRMNGCQTIALERVGDLSLLPVAEEISGLWAGASQSDRPTALVVQVADGMAELQATWPANLPDIERDLLRLSLIPVDPGLGRLFWVPVGVREATGAFVANNARGTHSLIDARLMQLTPTPGGLEFQMPVRPQDVARMVSGEAPKTRDSKAGLVTLTRPDDAAREALASGETPPARFEGSIGGALAAAASREAQCRALDAWVAPDAAGVDMQRQSPDAIMQRLAGALEDDRFVPVFGLPFLMTTQVERRSVARFIQSTCRGQVHEAVLFMGDFVLMTDSQFARFTAQVANRRETASWLTETRAALPGMAETAETEAELARLRQEAERERPELLPEEKASLLAEIDRRAAEVRAGLLTGDIAALSDDGFARGDLGRVLSALDKAQDLPGDLREAVRAVAEAKAAAMLAEPKAAAVAVVEGLPQSLDGLRQAQAAMAPLAAWRQGMEAAFGSLDPEGVLRPLHARIAELRADAGVQAEFADALAEVEARSDAEGAVLAAAAPYIAADDLIHAPEFAQIVEKAVLHAELRQVKLVDNAKATSPGEPTIADIATFVFERVRSANAEIRRQETQCMSGDFNNDPLLALACLSQPAVWSGQTGQFGVVLLGVEKLGCTEEVADARYLCLFIQTIDINLPDGMGIGGIPGLTSGEVLDALFLRTEPEGWRVVWGDLD